MAEQGWIKLHRCLLNNPIWTQEKFNRGSAWVDLILMVNHEDKKVLFDGGLIECKRGERITSIRQLSERWKWSRDKTKRFLDVLQADGMIKYKTDRKKTIISIVNYGVYQDKPTTEKPQNDHRKATEKPLTGNCSTTDRPLTDTNKNDKEYIKNDKERKECKEEKPTTPPLSFPTHYHSIIFDNFGEVAYRTWFQDADIKEKEGKLIIDTADFQQQVIKDRYLNELKLYLKKDIQIGG